MKLDIEAAVEIAARSKFEDYQARLSTTEFDPDFHKIETWDDVHEVRKAALRSAAWPYVEAVFVRIASDAWEAAAEYYGVGAADVREGKQDNPFRAEAPKWRPTADDLGPRGGRPVMEVPDETPWTCHTCGARAWDLEGWGINPNHTLYCNQCEATP